MINTLQILLNSLVSGLILSLVAISFTYIFQVTKVFHIANGGIYVIGAYSCWGFYNIFNNLFFSFLATIFVVTITIWLIEKLVYLPLNKKKTNQTISLISSVGVDIVIINLIALIFGNENKVYSNFEIKIFSFWGIIITQIQLIQIIICIITIILFLVFLKYSKSNIKLNAIANNEILSQTYGINTPKERIKIFIAGTILTTIAAILNTFETGLQTSNGISITLTAAVICIIVSRLHVFYIILFSVVLIIIENTIEWFLNAQWKNGIVFGILLLVVLFTTEGILSYKLRNDRL